MSGNAAKVAQLQARDQAKRLSREDLLTIRKREEEVELASFGGDTVIIRTLTARERREFREMAGYGSEEWDEDYFTALCVAASMVEPKLELEDAKVLMEQESALWDELTLNVNLINIPGAKLGVKDLGKDSKTTES